MKCGNPKGVINVQRRISYLIAVFSLIFIFFIYWGLKPRLPRVTPVESNILSELTMKLTVNYPEADKIDAELFNNVLRVHVAYKGFLDDLKTQTILRTLKSNIYEQDIGKSKFNSIEVNISNTTSTYRYSTAAPLDNNNSVVTIWKVNKVVIINDKEINSESIFEE